MSTGRFLLLSWDSIHGVPPYDVYTVTWWVYLYLVCNDGELGTARHGSSKHFRVIHRNNKALGHMYIRLDCCFPPTSDETTHEAHAIDAYLMLTNLLTMLDCTCIGTDFTANSEKQSTQEHVSVSALKFGVCPTIRDSTHTHIDTHTQPSVRTSYEARAILAVSI